ncbi:MAG: ribokinase [Casimicrobiaceae bacterium]
MIVVFGSINLDLVARVARLPRPGETLAGSAFAAHPGGKGANQALAAERAGADVLLFGAVGSDAFATPALRGLDDAGMDLTGVDHVEGPTGVALIHVDDLGENSITVVAGANDRADPASVPDALLAPGTTVLMQLEVPLSAVAALAQRARGRGARVILNAAPWQPLPHALLSSLDVLVVNESEAAAIAHALGAPATPEAFATGLFRRFGCAVVVTLGADGALAVVGARLIRASAPILRVVDTTGAGDAFTGVLAAELHSGASWNRALAAGVAAGTVACMNVGAQSALPAAASIEKLASTVESGLVSHPID